MPLNETILGLSNTWFRPAMDHAEECELEKDLKIRLVAPVYFCASKLEAFAGRGRNNFHVSRELEDLIAVVDGRAELVGEIQDAASDVRFNLALASISDPVPHIWINAIIEKVQYFTFPAIRPPGVSLPLDLKKRDV